MEQERRTQILLLTGVGLSALAGMVLLWLSTRWGPGIGGDATIYIFSAKNLLAGKGLGLVEPSGNFRLLPYFPPFFSLVLAFFGLFGLDLSETARWVNLVSFGGVAVLVGFCSWKALRSILPGAVWGVPVGCILAWVSSLLVALSPVLIPIYAWAMSEPLAIFLGFASLAVLVTWLEKPQGYSGLIWAGVLGGLSFLTRYGSAAFLGTGGLGLLFLASGTWRSRIGKALCFGGVGVFPMALWVVYDISQTATVSSRSLISAAETGGRLVSFFENMENVFSFWLIPDSWFYNPFYPAILNRIAVVLFLVGLVAWGWVVSQKTLRIGNKEKIQPGSRWLWVLVVFSLVYLAVILFVYLTTYPPITIGTRMLTPVHVAVLVIITLLGGMTLSLWPGKRILTAVVLVGLLGFTLWYGWRSLRITAQLYQTGQGYTSPDWRGSETIRSIQTLPENTVLISNEPNAILYLTGRSAYPFMENYREIPLPTYTRYGDGDLEGDQPQRIFRENGAALVLFDTIDDQLSGFYGDRTGERLLALVKDLKRYFRGADGGIFFYK